MILLIPLSRFRIEYEIASGRPYTKLDLLLLRAVQVGPLPLKALEDMFLLPARLIIDILVNLFHERWISVSEEGFTLTTRGRLALERGEIPASRVIVPARTDVWLERITGGVASKSEIRYETTRSLRNLQLWDDSISLRAEFTENSLDQGQVRHLLRPARGQWICNVAPPTMTSREHHWLPVDIDPNTGAVIGLPDRWRTRLNSYLMDRALMDWAMSSEPSSDKKFWTGDRRPRQSESPSDSGWYSEVLSTQNLVKGSAHLATILDYFASAASWMLICSPLSTEIINEFAGPICETLARGIHIDLIWCQSSDKSIENIKEIAVKIQKDANSERKSETTAPGVLRITPEPVDFAANFLMRDGRNASDQMEYAAVIGSFPWLGSRVTSADVSLEIRHPGIMEQLCLSAASLIEGQAERSGIAVPDRFHHIAADLAREHGTQNEIGVADVETKANLGGDHSSIRFVRDQDHSVIFSECLATAQFRVGLCSGTADSHWCSRFASLSKNKISLSPVHVILGSNIGSKVLDANEPEPEGKHLDVVRNTKVRGNILIADTSVLITSYPFLGDPSITKRRPDIGLQIENPEIAEYLWKYLVDASAGI
jgi:hypothetical protein